MFHLVIRLLCLDIVICLHYKCSVSIISQLDNNKLCKRNTILVFIISIAYF